MKSNFHLSEYGMIGGLVQKIEKDSFRLSKIPLWIFPLVISLLFFQIKGVKTSPDSAWYIAKGLNLYHGLGYVGADWLPDTGRGPVFPGLIALSFWIFGVSIQSALWVVRLFFVLNVVLVYAIGAVFFNRTTGFIASLLVLTSFTLHKGSSYILLDNVVPFFILLSQLLLFIAFEKKNKLYFCLAGGLLGVGFLTKETAALFLPLPVLLWLFIPTYRVRAFWQGIFIFWLVAFMMIASWFLYSYLNGNGSYPVLDRVMRQSSSLLSPPESNTEEVSFDLSLWLNNFGQWLGNYYRNYLENGFILGPFFLVAWGYILLRVILKRSRAETGLLSGLILFLPIILLQGRVGLREGQSFYLFLLSYLALARLFWLKEMEMYKVGRAVSGLVILLALAAQIWIGDNRLVQIFNKPKDGIYALSLGQNDWQVSGEHKIVTEAGEWLRKNLGPGEAILMDGRWSNALYFYLDARQPIYRVSYLSSHVHLNAYQPVTQKYYLTPPKDLYFSDHYPLSPILFVWPQQGRTDPNFSKSWLNALSEPELFAQIQKLQIKYVVVTQRLNFFSLYLQANLGFEEVQQFEEGKIKIFRVRDHLASISFPTHFEPSTFTYLRRAAQETPGLYERLVEDYIVRVLGIERALVEKVVSNHDLIIRPVEFEHIY